MDFKNCLLAAHPRIEIYLSVGIIFTTTPSPVLRSHGTFRLNIFGVF
jgi:hypothetical protein